MPITTKLKAVSLGVSLALAGLLVGCNQNDSDPLVKDDAYYRGQAEAMVARARELKRCLGVNLNHRFTPAAVLAKIVARIPVGRLGHADEIARGVLFLCGEDAGFVTGSTMSINGGQHMY